MPLLRGSSLYFLDSCDAFADQHHGEDQEQDGHHDCVVLAQPGFPAVQDRLGLLAHREHDHERGGHADHGDEYVHRASPHLLTSGQTGRGYSHRRCHAYDDVLRVERADAYTDDQGLPGSEPSYSIHSLWHRRLLARLWPAAELAQRGGQQQHSQHQLENRGAFRWPRTSGQVDRSGDGDEYRQHASDTENESGKVAGSVGDRLLREKQQDLGNDRYWRDRYRDGEGENTPDDILHRRAASITALHNSRIATAVTRRIVTPDRAGA